MKTPLGCCVLAALVACQPKGAESPQDPSSSSEEPNQSAVEPLDPSSEKSYIGLSLEAAQQLAESAGLPHRVIREDGEDRIVTRDYRPNRLNFVVENHTVTAVTKG